MGLLFCFQACGMPQTLQKGTTYLNSGTIYPNTAVVVCEAGFRPSASVISCNSSGKWDNATCDKLCK
jgi:hypothetical protein